MIPKRLEILGKKWTVETMKFPDEMEAYGICKHAQSRIMLHSEQSPDNLRDSLLHEITHAIDTELDLKMGERRVRLVATGLLQVLRNNKALVAFLTDAGT